MKEEVRGLIEKALDEYFEDEAKDAVAQVSWVEELIPITSKRELVLGYLIGTMETFAQSIAELMRRGKPSEVEEEKEEKEINTMIRRRLTEILECIESELNK